MESLSVLICRVANNYKIHLINLIKDHVSSSIIEANKCINSIPEVNWSLGSLNKAEASSSNSLSISAIRRGTCGAMFLQNSNGMNGDFTKRNNLTNKLFKKHEDWNGQEAWMPSVCVGWSRAQVYSQI